LVNAPVYAGAVASVADPALTVTGATNIGASLTSGTAYYLEVTADTVNAGAYAGDRFDVDTAATIAAANGTVVIKSSLENTIQGTLPAALAGTNFVIRAHVTLGSLVTALPGLFISGDQVFLKTNGGSVLTYTYNGTNWKKGLTTSDSIVVYPGVGFAFSRSGATATSAALVGNVRTNNFVQAIQAGDQILAEGFPVSSSANPTNGSFSRLLTDDQGATFANGDKLYAVNPNTGTLTTFTYNSTTNKWTAGLTNGNTIQLFQPTAAFFLSAATANTSYVYVRPFTL
jgi:hypothetical protein